MIRTVALILASLTVLNLSAWSGYNIKATDLMDNNQYIEAAQLWNRHTAEIEDALNEGSDATSLIADLLKSISNEINCLYMIDDYQSMQRLHDKYQSLVDMYGSDFDKDMALEAKAYQYKNTGALNYGATDHDANAYARSEQAYLNALDYADEYDTDFIATTYLDLAQLYYKWGQTHNRHTEYAKALDALNKSALNTPRVMSMKAITRARIGSTTDDDTEASRYFAEATTEIGKAINAEKSADEKAEMMRKKGKILMLQADRLNIDTYPEARKCYEQYLDIKKNSIKKEYGAMTESQRRQNWLALHRFIYDCCRLGQRGADLSYDIALYSKGYLLRPNSSKPATWREIAAKLGKDEAAIEFLAFDDRLIALVVKNGYSRPQMIDICGITETLNHEIYPELTLGKAIVSQETADKNLIYECEALPKMIWTDALMHEIADMGKVYFSPDGFLHQLAIEYMLPDSTVTAYRLSSTARLLKPHTVPKGNMLLCGGVDYYNADTDATNGQNDSEAYRYLEGKVSTIKYLPGSKTEIDSIYTARGNRGDKTIAGSAATESRIRTEAPNYNMLHLSTHGYFATDTHEGTDLKSTVNDNALSHSGLILAGAASNLRNGDFDPLKADGILSAAEIAGSDWSNVELVVLSACESGLGYQTDDGIYGLQRGLKMSGADGMILSLWEVDDQATYMLMKYFYDELAKADSSAHDSFMRARERLIDSGTQQGSGFSSAKLSRSTSSPDKKGKYSKPKYSYPFIVIDLF